MPSSIVNIGGLPPLVPWQQFAVSVAGRVDAFIEMIPVLGDIVQGYGGAQGVVHSFFSSAKPSQKLPEYISAFDAEKLSARKFYADIVAGETETAEPLLILSIDKVGKSQFISDFVDSRVWTERVFKIVMEPVVGTRWSKISFEEGFRESLANAMSVEIEAQGGAPAREVLKYIKASMRRNKKDVMDWLDKWLSRNGYSAAVIAVHEAMLWKPEHLAEKLTGRKKIFTIMEYHNYAVNTAEIEAAFPRGYPNEYKYIGFLSESSLVSYIRHFQELNSAYLRPMKSRLAEYIYLITGGWLEAVNFILEEVSDPKRRPVGAKYPKEITVSEIDQAARRFGGVERLRSYVEKLDEILLTALRGISRIKIKKGEFDPLVEKQLTGMGLVHEAGDGNLELSGSMLEAALLPPAPHL